MYADVRHNVGGWGLYDCVHVNRRRLVTAFWCMWTMVGWKLCAQHEIVYVCGCGRLEMCDCACGLTKLGGMLETARLCIGSWGLSEYALGGWDLWLCIENFGGW